MVDAIGEGPVARPRYSGVADERHSAMAASLADELQ